MRPYIIALLLLGCLPFSLAGEAKNSYRIQRDQPYQKGQYDNNDVAQVSSRSKRVPLNGQIEVQEEGSLLDPEQFSGRIPMNGNAGKGRLDGNTRERGPLQSGLEDGGLQSGLDDSRLRPMNAGSDQMRFTPSVTNTRLRGDLTDQELKQLATHDIVIMQDRSSSMGEKDYFPMVSDKISKWQWCMSQSMDLTRQIVRLPKIAFTLVVFSSQYDVYQNVRLAQLPGIISNCRNGIFIGTKLAAPMHDQLSQYFQRRAAGRARPLIIAVVTDGKPQDEHDLRDVIIQATQMMHNPNEIKIKFLQVGNDDEGQKKLHKLDMKLIGRGARYDIVHVEPFAELANEGLPRALLRAIKG
ncbi:MAG: hypothetical protein C0469_14755 [Cyanobacteria bacterium DS2.3.42]|nr:hypothetical protein [Cyanobacteria bacterium DS2.3.42]